MVNLTTLAPEIVAAILDDTLPAKLTLFDSGGGSAGAVEKQWNRVAHDASNTN